MTSPVQLNLIERLIEPAILENTFFLVLFVVCQTDEIGYSNCIGYNKSSAVNC